ncbi:MAG: SDR family oxidoreductase [Rhodospirillales bacterium]
MMSVPKGLRVLVTAGAGGIGLAVAQAFAEAEARVFVCDLDGEALAALPTDWGWAEADVGEEAAVRRLFTAVEAELGGLDVLVACAGIAGPTGPLESLSLADWRRCLAVNLDGTFLCCRAAIPLLRRAGGGLIVTFSSTAGFMGYPERSPYATAKWGMIGLTKSLAMELGPDGIRVNALCPGAVAGPRMDRVIAAEAASSGRSDAEVRADYASANSLQRFVTAEEMAGMILYLTTAPGSAVSGQALPVDGHTVRP